MSMEAVGQNGAVLGSDMYWNQLNSNTILGGLMQWASGTEYYRTLQETATRASTAIEEVYDDFRQILPELVWFHQAHAAHLQNKLRAYIMSVKW